MAIFSPITIARFWSKVDVQPSNLACWPWKASRNRDGYGRFKDGGSVQNASRVAWEIANDARLRTLVARHKCDNPCCCNPAHIEAGTHADNVNDKVARGRARSAGSRGESNPMAKLTEADVVAIRCRIAGGETDRQISASYPVTSGMIHCIRKGKSWAHLVGRDGIEPPTDEV